MSTSVGVNSHWTEPVSGLLTKLSGLIAELRATWMSDSDFSASLAVVCRHARQIVDTDRVYALIREGEELRVVSASGDGIEEIPYIRLSLQDREHAVVRAIQTKQRLIENGDRPKEPFFGATLLAEPILTNNEPVGALLFTRDAPRTFEATDGAEAAVIASEASFAYGLHRRARELKLIYEVTRTINSSLQSEEVLEFIYQGISQILRADNFYIALWDGGDEIRFEIEIEEHRRLPKRKRRWLGGLTEHLLTTAKPLLLRNNVAAHRERLGIKGSGRPARCWMGAPMVFRNKSVGVIALQSYEEENVYDEAHLSVLENIAGQAAGAIENARLFEQTRTSLQKLQMTQQALLQAEKLAAVGQLISGIAHELNNPLTGVVGWTQYLLVQPLSDTVARHLATINQQALRASKIVQNLLAFSRQHKPEQQPADLNEIIENTLALRAYELRVNNITVKRQYARGLPQVAVDSHQLQQVILNLIINAEQAILSAKYSGGITISTKMVEQSVRITIADDGPGIAPEMLARIFEPFFTTKPIGQGTGLGLSISFGIIQEHGGRIWVDSKPNLGAQFVIELPISASGKTLPAQEPNGLEREQRAVYRASVLVVDDEESVRDLLRIILEECSLTVELATNGEEALAKSCQQAFDLILSDFKMPGLSGSEFYERLRRIRPGDNTRFVFVTGDVLSPETHEFLDSTHSLCVLKPFDIKQVKKTVMEALNCNSPAGSANSSIFPSEFPVIRQR